MRRLHEHTRRRRTRLSLFALLTAVSLGLGAALLVSGDDTANQLVGVGSLFVALASLVVALVQTFSSLPPPAEVTELADYLAVTVREQWEEETTARRLRDPRVIPLVWSATDRPVTGPPESVVGPVDARVLRLSVSGRLEGGFDQAAERLADGYRSVPSGRLVMLGEPGAGKTVLAVMLTLGLLRERAPQAPVPVLLAVSSWDPVSESLDDWIVGTLATAYYGGRPDIPQRLLARRLLLPILDGLDEIPEAARRSAVRAVNHACGDGRGVVLTCRSAEYEDVIEGGSPVLRRAPVVEVAPVSVPDGIAYLRDVSWPVGIDWEPVYERLQAEPAGAPATALSTPLALSLARTVYRHCARDPRELLGFDSRHAVEDHLVDHVVTAAYAPPPGSGEQPADGVDWHQQAKRAEQWLTYLATYLHRHRERDLAWWLMSRRLLSRWFGLVVGMGLGLISAVAVVTVGHLLATAEESESLVPGMAVSSGAGLAVLATLTWYAAADRPPGRVSFTARGSLGRLRPGFTAGLTLTAILAVPLMAAGAVVITFNGSWDAKLLTEYLVVIAVVAATAVAIGVAFAVHDWLDAPPERSAWASPLDILRQDRKSSLACASIAGAVFGVALLPLAVLGVAAGWLTVLMLTGWSREPSLIDLVGEVTANSESFSTPLMSATATLLPATVFALLVLMTRAWPKFLLLRVVLAARGRLPWRLTRFLSDARDRQLLRQSAGTYQFRHIRLQERLASRSLAEDRTPPPRAQTVRRRRIRVAVASAALVVAGLTLADALPEDSSQVTIITGDTDAMALSPDGQILVAAGGGEVRQWNTANGDEFTNRRYEIDGERRSVASLAVRDNGTVVVITPAGSESEGYYRWRVLEWDEGRGPVSVSDEGVVEADRSPVLSSGGTHVAAKAWDVTGVQAVDSEGDAVVSLPSSVTWDDPLALTADGTQLLTRMGDGVVLGDVRTGEASGRFPSVGRVWSALAMNADGSRLASAVGQDVQTWDTTGKKDGLPLTGHTQTIDLLALDADGSVLAATANGTTRLWELTRAGPGRFPRQPGRPHPAADLAGLAFPGTAP
ncbi:hypothetical protein [Streptomyces sp. NPDC002788]